MGQGKIKHTDSLNLSVENSQIFRIGNLIND